MDETISLLEQCLLYNNSQFKPFQEPSNSQPAASGKPELGPNSKRAIESVQEHPTDSSAVRPTRTTSLSSAIDLNFELPLNHEQYIPCSTMPLFRSTSRRDIGRQSKQKPPRYRLCRKLDTWRKSRRKSAPGLPTQKQPVDHATPQNNTKFMALPGEIRTLIYEFLFGQARVFVNQNPHYKHVFDTPIAIRSTCKAIHTETAKPLFNSLKIIFDYSSIPITDTQIAGLIPDHVWSELQWVEIRVQSHTDLLPALRFSKPLPKIQQLKVVEIEEVVRPDGIDMDTCLQGYKELCTPRLAYCGKHLGRWQNACPNSNEPSTMMITYEFELWLNSLITRAACLGLPPRRIQNPYLCTFSGGAEAAQITRLDADQFEKRHEGYFQMEKDGVAFKGYTLAREVSSLLENLRYRDVLDNIEAGLTRLHMWFGGRKDDKGGKVVAT